MSLKNPQVPRVECKNGAPLGRSDIGDRPTGRCRCFRLKFVDSGYDEGGAYWGLPENVYCITNDDGSFVRYVRENCRQAAKYRVETLPFCGDIKWKN